MSNLQRMINDAINARNILKMTNKIKNIKTGKANKDKPVFYSGTGITLGTAFRSTSAYPVKELKMLTAEDIAYKFKPIRPKRLLPKNTMIGEYLRHGVYLLFYNKEVVYVGQSVCPYQRIFAHKNKKLFDEFRILHCSSRRALYWEKKLIDFFNPKLNKIRK